MSHVSYCISVLYLYYSLGQLNLYPYLYISLSSQAMPWPDDFFKFNQTGVEEIGMHCIYTASAHACVVLCVCGYLDMTLCTCIVSA